MDLVPIIPNSSSMRVPCQSRKAISQSNWFIYLGKSFETIPKEHEIEPTLGWSNGQKPFPDKGDAWLQNFKKRGSSGASWTIRKVSIIFLHSH